MKTKVFLILICLSFKVTNLIGSTFLVTNFTDNTSGNPTIINTLRWAIESANANPDPDIILFQTTTLQTIALNYNLDPIIYPLEIIGPQGNVPGADWNDLLVTIVGVVLFNPNNPVFDHFCFRIESNNCKIEKLRFEGADCQIFTNLIEYLKIQGCNFIHGRRGFIINESRGVSVKNNLFGSRSTNSMTINDEMLEPNAINCFTFSSNTNNLLELNEIGGRTFQEYNTFCDYGGTYSIGSNSYPRPAIEINKDVGLGGAILGNRFINRQSLAQQDNAAAFISCTYENPTFQTCNLTTGEIDPGTGYPIDWSVSKLCQEPLEPALVSCDNMIKLEFFSNSSAAKEIFVYKQTNETIFLNDFSFYASLLLQGNCSTLDLFPSNLQTGIIYYQRTNGWQFSKAKIIQVPNTVPPGGLCSCPLLSINNSNNPPEDPSNNSFCNTDQLYFGLNGTMSPSGLSVLIQPNGILLDYTANPSATYVLSVPGLYSAQYFSNGMLIGTFPFEITNCEGDVECNNCITSFSPLPGERYLISAWVKEERNMPDNLGYLGPKFRIEQTDDQSNSTQINGTLTRNPVVDGWQMIEYEFLIAQNTVSISINLECVAENDDNCLFDDIKIIPADASAKCYVYDPLVRKIRAEFDPQHFATLYEYDAEGNLVRLKKETERGIMTVKESTRSLNKKQP